MKKTTLFILSSLLFLTACNGGTTPPADDDPGTGGENQPTNPDNPDDPVDPGDEPTDPVDPPSPGEEVTTYKKLSIKEAKEALTTLSITPNQVGIFVSDYKVEITGRLLATYDTISTKKYDNDDYSYKALIADETDYIYVTIPQDTYKKVKDYALSDNSYYTAQGVLTNWIGIDGIKADSFTWQNGHEDICPISKVKSFVEEINDINDIDEYAKTLSINCKGVQYGKLMAFNGKYLAKMDNSVLLFGDGNTTIRVHGSTKVGNNFTVGKSYTIYGTVGYYIYQKSFEYIASTPLDEEVNDIDLDNIPYITAQDLYNISYENNNAKHYSFYEDICGSLRRFKGYVNYYTVSSTGYHLVLTDTYLSTSFATYTAAANGKALVIKNDTENGLYYDKDLTYSSLAEYALENVEIDIVLTPYLLNTQHYWQIYIL